jgi:hypothetical protein
MSDGFSDYSLADDYQGQWARVKVLPDAPQYATIREICESGKPDKRAWRWDRSGHLWVSYHLFMTQGAYLR